MCPQPRLRDLFLTHDTGGTTTLYVNDGQGAFEDRTDIMGLAAGSLASTGFGTGWVDGVERQFEPLAVDRYRILRRSR